jgi:hypothetical protein
VGFEKIHGYVFDSGCVMHAIRDLHLGIEDKGNLLPFHPNRLGPKENGRFGGNHRSALGFHFFLVFLFSKSEYFEQFLNFNKLLKLIFFSKYEQF